jgi:hypothetical protein
MIEKTDRVQQSTLHNYIGLVTLGFGAITARIGVALTKESWHKCMYGAPTLKGDQKWRKVNR